MKINLILLLIWCIKTQSIFIKNTFNIQMMTIPNFPFYNNRLIDVTNYVKRKKHGYLKLIRYKNILPTVLLSFTGGWIINPSITYLIRSKEFIISLINTIIIMSSSMVINDIFDIEIDKINNPERPLVTGEITKNEAILFTGILLTLSEVLSIHFLPFYLQCIVHLSIFEILIYTKILKPMFLIKNISCAYLISFSLFFSGISTSSVYNEKNAELLIIAIKLIFFGSLHNEMLLDICDIDGDKTGNIHTFPVVFGVENTWKFIYLFTHLNILLNSIHLIRLYNSKLGIVLLFTCSQLINNLSKITKHNYLKSIVKNAVNESTIPLFTSLIYLCWLATLK